MSSVNNTRCVSCCCLILSKFILQLNNGAANVLQVQRSSSSCGTHTLHLLIWGWTPSLWSSTQSEAGLNWRAAERHEDVHSCDSDQCWLLIIWMCLCGDLLTSMTALVPASTALCWWLLSSSCCSSSRLMSTFSTVSETSTLHTQALTVVCNIHTDTPHPCLHRFLPGRPSVSTYLSRAGLRLLLSTTEAAELLPSRTDCTMATGRTGGSEGHTSQVEVKATASPPPTPPPFPPPLTPGLTGSSFISIMHFSLSAESNKQRQTCFSWSHTVCNECTADGGVSIDAVEVENSHLFSPGCIWRAMLAWDMSVTSDMIGPPVSPPAEQEAVSLGGWGGRGQDCEVCCSELSSPVAVTLLMYV